MTAIALQNIKTTSRRPPYSSTTKEYEELKGALLDRVPSVKTWLDCYTEPVRVTILFPATAKVKVDRSKLKKDTNAQEGLRSEFRRLMVHCQKKAPIMDTVRMVHT
ncbi:hypothetical protein BGX28_010099 [Mortierella sp. GBA30]|nr:hypothetical protein BGX28_010099 [Mortierella sp. GBA30]